MTTIFGVPTMALFGQLLIGLINGSFYALLSLGLAVIFGMLNIINFSHGALYMMGAFAAYLLMQYLGIGYWPALVVVPFVVGAVGVIIERLFLQWLYKLDHLYSLLLTFGLALIIEGVARNFFGSAGLPYSVPASLQGVRNLGFMYLPNYRAWVIVASLEHARRGLAEGFVMANHGKRAPLARMSVADRIVVYSARTAFPGGDPFQAIAIVGTVIGPEPEPSAVIAGGFWLRATLREIEPIPLARVRAHLPTSRLRFGFFELTRDGAEAIWDFVPSA